jgi:hypothetical protein
MTINPNVMLSKARSLSVCLKHMSHSYTLRRAEVYVLSHQPALTFTKSFADCLSRALLLLLLNGHSESDDLARG